MMRELRRPIPMIMNYTKEPVTALFHSEPYPGAPAPEYWVVDAKGMGQWMGFGHVTIDPDWLKAVRRMHEPIEISGSFDIPPKAFGVTW